MAAERIDEQIGAERRSADADVEQMADLAERARFDRVDHHPHPLMQSLCGMDRFRRAIATLGAMLGRAVFGGIGDAAREERLAPAREIRSEEHKSELQSLMRTSHAVFCLKT